MENKIELQGIYLNKRKENAPSWIKGSISIKVEKFVEFMKTHQNQSGYVNLDLKESKAGDLYLAFNDFQSKPKDITHENRGYDEENINFADIKF